MMARRSMATRQQVNAEYAATMTDASDTLAAELDRAAARLHERSEAAYAQYQRATSLAHRRYWQASDLARESRDEGLRWAVHVKGSGEPLRALPRAASDE